MKKAYEELVSNSRGDPVLRTIMLIIIIDLLLTSCGLDRMNLYYGSIDDKGATIIACGLKLSTKVAELVLCKQTPARL